MNAKRILISLALAGVLLAQGTTSALAGMTNVVTLGANLSEAQKNTVLKYFDVNKDEVSILEVTNEETRKYLEGIAPEAQLGTKTFSCAYVQPTNPGSGIKVKTVNITYVTSNMIASTLATCGITDANVIAMSPIPVSGTGALTGVMKAFEDATGEKLPEEKKEIASEELVVTGNIAGEVGADKATGIINDIKIEVIKENTKDTVQIAETIVNVTNNYNVTLTQAQQEEIKSLMEKIAEQDYNYSEIKETLETIGENVEDKLEEIGESIDKGLWEDIKATVSGWMESIGDFFSGIFDSSNEEDLGILGETNDNLLGEDVVVDATEDEAVGTDTEVNEAKGFFEKLWDWFTGLFDNNEDTNTDKDNSVEDNNEAEDTNIDAENETNETEEQSEDTIIGGDISGADDSANAEDESTTDETDAQENIDINDKVTEENTEDTGSQETEVENEIIESNTEETDDEAQN